MTDSGSTNGVKVYTCPVCKGSMTNHKNDNHVICSNCGYYTNVVFMQYFIQSQRELEKRDELEKAPVETPPKMP